MELIRDKVTFFITLFISNHTFILSILSPSVDVVSKNIGNKNTFVTQLELVRVPKSSSSFDPDDLAMALSPETKFVHDLIDLYWSGDNEPISEITGIM